MSHADIAGASRPSRGLTLASLLAWLVLVIALPLSALTLNVVRFAGFPLGFWIAAQGALLGLAILAIFYAWRAGGESAGDGVRPALVFAGEALGAVTILGFTGYIAALGYDGLALPLGLIAGLALLAMLVAPRFVLYPVRSISGFFAVRYGGAATRRLAFVITLIAGTILLAADLRAGAFAVQGLTRIGLNEAIAGLAVTTGAVWLLNRVVVPRRIAGIGFILILAGMLTTLVALALHSGGSLLPQLTLGAALEGYASLNVTLVVNKLSDIKSLTPMASPFLQLSLRNFAGLLLAVALGVVAAPHLLGRHVSRAAVTPGAAVRRTALALAATMLVAVSLAPLAIYSRLGFEQVLVKGVENAAIPQSIADASGLGWLKVCDTQSSVVADLAAGCAKASGQRGFLRLQDLSFTTDGFIAAAPGLAGVDRYLQYPLLIAVLLAALLMGNGLVAGLVTSDAEVRTMARARANASPDFRSFALGFGLLLAACLVAMSATIGSGLLAAEGFALLAAGICPALVLGLHWRRMNATGAVCAMLAGFIIAVLYLSGVHFWPAEFYRVSGGLSDGGPQAAKKFADLQAALSAASDPAPRATARLALEQYAGTIANWWGLKPSAIVLMAVPAGVIAGVVGSLVKRSPVAPASS